MFFSVLVALWMTYGVAGSFEGPLIPLHFTEEPIDTIARRNEAVKLNCLVEGSPSPTNITWEKDGQRISTDSRRKIGSNGALLISKIIHKREHRPDVGEYQCFASSPVGTIASRKVHLGVAGLSKKFLYEPQNTTAWEGSIARFSCQVRHAVPPATITWEKDGSPLRSGDRVVILDHGVLQIKNIKKADEGNYKCIASNLARTSYSQAASLTVQRGSSLDKTRLKFLSVSRNTTVFKGGTTVLECAATGYPTPTITWRKLDGYSQVLSIPKSAYGVSNLNFTNVSESDGGEYECQASSNGRNIFRSVWLIVRVPPQFTKKPARLKWGAAEPIVLKCEVTGSPMPSLSWLKDGNELASNAETRVTYYEGGSDLTIPSRSSSDGGIYQCFAKNEVGSIQASVVVIVPKSVLGPPTNVVALSRDSSSILISWSPPVGNYSINAYTVHYQKAGDTEKEVVVDGDAHSHKIDQLHGFTNYSLYVRAYTKVMGMKSATVVESTLQGKPDRPPVNVKVTSKTPDSLDVEWQPPPKDYQNGVITKYVIMYEESGQRGLPKTLEVPGHIHRNTINGLLKGKTYSIKVSAATAKGHGPPSLPVTGTVLLRSTSVISAPTLWIAGTNSSALNVRWLPPKFGQDSIKEYHLFYVQLKHSKTEQGPFIVGKQYQSFLLHELTAGSEFLIKLMAWDGKTLGQPGAVFATTDKDPNSPGGNSHRLPPSRPIHLVCRVESPTSILLTWQRPLAAERIAYYTVKYHLRYSSNPEPVERRVTTENIIINGLSYGRDYTIFVQSHYETETKKYPSDISTTQTYCSIPLSEPSSPPRNVKFEYKSVRSVEITWEHPAKLSGELTSYEIFYTYNNSFPDSKWIVVTRRLGVISNYAKKISTMLIVKENTTLYLKIRAKNKEGHGPFCDTLTIKPPVSVPRVAPNITYTIKLPGRVELSWECPRIFNAFVTSFTVLYTNNLDLPEDKWNMQRVVPGSSERFANIVRTTVAVDEHKTYHIKVRAEYDDNIPGEWSEIAKISTNSQGDNASSSKDPRVAELDDNPAFNIKLGIIIGCTISAFCIVVLILFIVWRNPCRQAYGNQGKEKAPVNGLPPLNGFLPSHQQQIAEYGKHDKSGSTEETSASSGMCQCRCTCGAQTRWPLGPTMIRSSNKLPGSSDSSTPITQVFASSTPGGASEESLSHEELRNKKDGYCPGSSSSSISVEVHRDQINTIPVLSRNYKQSISVDV